MKALLQVALLCLAGSAFSQTLYLPPRDPTAPAGKVFAQAISPLGFAEREQEIYSQVMAGNVPEFLRRLCPVTVTNVVEGRTNIMTFFTTPDYLAIGSDEDFLLMPMSPNTAQRIADQLGCVLPTRKMVDAIYASAEVKLTPSPIPPSAAMTTVPVFARHNEMIRTQRMAVWESHFESAPSPRQSGERAEVRGVEPDDTSASSPRPPPPFGMEERGKKTNSIIAHLPGALAAGHKKDVVLSARLASVTNKVAIYGWHRTNGVPIQPLYLGHAASWVDYSQCIRLIKRELVVNGETSTVAQVLADPKLFGLLNDEGVLTNARYPTNFVGDDVRRPAPSFDSAKTNSETPHAVSYKDKGEAQKNPSVSNFGLAFPEKFSTSGHFDEMVREINLPEDVRILINAPSPDSFAPGKPVLLVFFALPNGNTIEQTIGKTLKPGDDWHFDIQHIGAQTRFLRGVLTNHALVVAYLEAGTKSWPAWRRTHDDSAIVRLIEGVRGIFSGRKLKVVLTGHSGGGSLTFGYLNAVEKIPDDVTRLAFLDSNYAYDTGRHAEKLKHWLAASNDHRLCVLAYHDSVALLNGKTFVSEQGGTWGRSRVMLNDLAMQFNFTSSTNNGLETFATPGGQIQFLLKENPEQKIFHTVQVERNGFIQALVSGTADEGRGYEYFGGRAYLKWIQEE